MVLKRATARFFVSFLRKRTRAMQSNITAAVARMMEPVLEEMGIELVEVQFRREAAGMVLRLIIATEKGVSVEDCRRVSREASYLLEVEDLIEGAFHLEVSSPGLDRPLKTERDFIRNMNREVQVTMKEPPGHQIIGTILAAANSVVTMQAGEERLDIPLERISRAMLVI
ncbi:MAG: ribosome maturation factor [Deltaproteobacteria bacterium CG_4_10_14_3_um_filter_60_8]|nr:MAG: ribosome maturation factor [Deltaproteobacteria bacterium CG23_combo_of_CG06-09_8_20_14_all_60_8]PIY21362.1 MAG: ribosome maturation factor [Deltaproteobacteria bacterium CG_4_10_14_3_um_filter_60_8]